MISSPKHLPPPEVFFGKGESPRLGLWSATHWELRWTGSEPLNGPTTAPRSGPRSACVELDPSLFRIGSHGAHHVPLTTLPPSEAVGQLAESRELLSRLAGGNVNSISFPYGDYDPALLDLVREAGYRFGYSNVAVWPWLSSNGMLRGRVSVEPFDWRLEFWLKIRGAYGWQALGGHWRHQWLPRLRNRPLASGTRATALPAPDIGSTIRQACSKRPFG